MTACVRQLNIRHTTFIVPAISLIVGDIFDDVDGLKDLRPNWTKLVTFFRTKWSKYRSRWGGGASR